MTQKIYEHGFLVVDKEPDMTSHDVVAIARRALGTRKVGHAGTLDPMATGVLVLGFNNGTRLLQYITDGDKSYQATVVLGASTVTDDFEGEVIATADASAITDDQINAELEIKAKIYNHQNCFPKSSPGKIIAIFVMNAKNSTVLGLFQ